MFVPRALRLKGVKEPKKAPKQFPTEVLSVETPASTQDKNTPTISPLERSKEISKPKSGNRFTNAPITCEYLQQLVCGVELIFTDYAHQDNRGISWLKKHYRDVDGESKFVHLSAIMEHPAISSLKPAPSHVLLQQALQEHPSAYLEIAGRGFFVRRNPSTYPLKFIPESSFDIVDGNGLSFWDQRTIYVEPHTRDLCKTPAKVAYWLKEYGALKDKWLPIQAVQMLYNSCAFVVLSGNVTHESIWQKWRDTGRPEYWKIMTKAEHRKRTDEYLELLGKERPKALQSGENQTAPSITSNPDPADCPTEDVQSQQGHKAKRKRKRPRKQGSIAVNATGGDGNANLTPNTPNEIGPTEEEKESGPNKGMRLSFHHKSLKPADSAEECPR